MDTVFVPQQHRPYEVVVTVPRGDHGEPLVPYALSPEVLACWSADQLIVSATAVAARPSGALEAIEALIPELVGAPGAAVTVRDAGSRLDMP